MTYHSETPSEFFLYAKALAVSLAAAFAICIAVIGLNETAKLFAFGIGFVLIVSCAMALIATIVALYFDYRNRK